MAFAQEGARTTALRWSRGADGLAGIKSGIGRARGAGVSARRATEYARIGAHAELGGEPGRARPRARCPALRRHPGRRPATRSLRGTGTAAHRSSTGHASTRPRRARRQDSSTRASRGSSTGTRDRRDPTRIPPRRGRRRARRSSRFVVSGRSGARAASPRCYPGARPPINRRLGAATRNLDSRRDFARVAPRHGRFLVPAAHSPPSCLNRAANSRDARRRPTGETRCRAAGRDRTRPRDAARHDDDPGDRLHRDVHRAHQLRLVAHQARDRLIASARYAATAPNQPTENLMCAVSTSLRVRCDVVMAGDTRPHTDDPRLGQPRLRLGGRTAEPCGRSASNVRA